MLIEWDKLPKRMQNDAVKRYYEILYKKKKSLVFKRVFDVITSAFLLILLSPIFLILAIAIKTDTPGPVFFRQVRVTQYGKKFRIFKFRTMITGAEKIGAQVTAKGDPRITRVGRIIRKYRLDELCQLIDIFRGTMSFVGTRPEVPKYVARYTDEMLATLLLPAGVTSEASIRYKDEEKLLEGVEDVDEVYVREVLPEKMKYNLEALCKFGLLREIKTIIKTVFAVLD